MLQPLGEWTADHSTNGRWRFYQGRERVFEFLGENWNKYTVQNNELIFAASRADVSLDGLLPTQVVKFLDRLRLEVPPEVRQSVELASRDSFDDFLLRQPEWKQDLIQNRTFGEGINSFMDVLHQHDVADGICIVSDGSVKEHNKIGRAHV